MAQDKPTLCEECNLPLSVCNGIAMQRKALQAAKAGNNEAALRLMIDAQEFFDDYKRAAR